MASTREKFTKDGRRFYEISVSRGRGLSYLTKRWYVPEGWSEKVVQRELLKVSAAFELDVKSGVVVSRSEKKTADEKAAAELAKIKTVRQYVDGVWMAAKKATISENTRLTYQMYLDQHILPVLGDSLIVEVTPAMLTKLLLDFQLKGKGHSHASCVKCYNILNGIFQSAFLDDTVTANPMLKVKRPAPRKDEKHTDGSEKALTVDQLQTLLDAMESESLKWRCYVYLAYDSGARRGELCALHWRDIDYKAQTITIRRNLQVSKDKGIYETTPKNGKSRTVDLGDDTIALLKELQKSQARSCISEYVFTQDGSREPMNPQSPTRYFDRLGKRIGIPGLHPHMLRHTSASLSITNGGDVVSVSERLGHSDTAVTLRMYAHANEESIRRAGQAVRDALKARKNA